jgi:hypothetical protein
MNYEWVGVKLDEVFMRLNRLEAMIPKIGSPSSTVDHENKGDDMATKRDEQAADYRAEAAEAPAGLRTERVTLDVTHARASVATWDWTWIIAGPHTGDPESVRVVEEDRILAASKKLIEVDQEAALRGFDTTTFQRLWISAIARVLGLELARPPRSKCDNPGDGSIPSPGILASPALVEAHQQIAALTAERDAAIRERDAAKARVAELEARTSTAGEGLRAAQAASGGGAEPVAWMCEWTDHTSLHLSKIYAESDGNGTVVPQPLYRAPPQPRGWLSEAERACLEKMRDELKRLLLVMSLKTVIGQDTERDLIAIESILVRSSPPEVVPPDMSVNNRCGGSEYCLGWTDADIDFRAAIAAAGVPVKEVG